jgi:tetratricopeptide (TPR) repeat protein
MDKLQEAVEAYKTALDIDKTYLAVRKDGGYARFAQAEFADAADDFGDALKLPRGRADTIVWLYLSRKHSRHPDASAELEDNASKLLKSNGQDWRIKLFKDGQLPESVRNPDDVLRDAKGTERGIDERCKMFFYIGEWHALREETTVDPREREAVEWLKRAATDCPFGLVERPAATAELRRLESIQNVAAMGASPGISTNRRRSRR